MITWKYKQKIRPSLTEEHIEVWAHQIKNIDFEEASYLAYGGMLLKFLMESTEGKGVLFTFQQMEFKKGVKLYRTRAMSEKEIEEIDNVSHFWAPPAQYVNYGRANKPKSPMLYTAINSRDLAIYENPEIKDDFIMIEYSIKNPFSCSYIGSLFNDNTNFKHDIPKTKEFNIINNFCKDLFSLKHTNEKYYIFTNGILDKIYALNKTSKYGYSYHSAIQRNLLNVSLNPSFAHKNLVVTEVLHMRKSRNNKYRILKRIKHNI